MTSPTGPAPLSERIAQLQGKVASPSPPQIAPSPSGSLAPSGNGLKRAVTLRDKIAKFEEKGGVPIPRGSFGLGAPPAHAIVPQRTGGLYGIRVPELGKGGTLVLSTPSHSRRGSFAESEGGDIDFPGQRDSRSPSPAFGSRLRTLSSTSSGKGANSENMNYRRTMHFPGDLSDKVRALRHASSIPSLADQIDFAAVQRGEDIPPVPALMPSARIQESSTPLSDRGNFVESEGLHRDAASRDVPPPAVSDADAAEALNDTGNEDTLDDSPQDILIPAPPVPALFVEEVDLKTPMPIPRQHESDVSASPTTPSISDFTPENKNSDDHCTFDTAVESPTQSLNPASTQDDVTSEIADPNTEDLPPASPILTPNTINSFPEPPIILPSKAATTSAVIPKNEEDDIPPPLPPKDDAQIPSSAAWSRNTSSSTAPTRRPSERSIDVPATSHTRANRSSDSSSAPPMTPPLQAPSHLTSVKRSVSPRQPVVIPNWWEDDEDQEVDGGWATVVR